jgi:serine/threonine-protein kinase
MERTMADDGVGVQEFLDSLMESLLLSPEEIERAVAALPGGATDGVSLGRLLVNAGVLTSYQMEAVRVRKFAELRIGNYDVLDRLGAGGMGTVFKARHRRMKRIVALKLLPQNLAKDTHFVRRFQREVETIARLSHRNIVMAHDADEDAAGPFLVMEFVNGCDLATLVTKLGPLSVADAVNCILQAAHGLAYAHDQGIIHRDIKPANLLRDGTGIVKVTDLGIARLSSLARDGESTKGSLTQTGGILGTVDYMAPEQAVDSTKIDCRADIYSLGATLYFLLAGEPPYPAQTVMAAFLKHRDAPIPSLTSVRADVPAALDAVFGRMMAKAPADRFSSMVEVIGELEKIETTTDAKLTPALPEVGRPGDTIAGGPSALGQNLDFNLATSDGVTGPTINLGPAGMKPADSLSVLLVEPSRTQSGIIRKLLEVQGIQRVRTAATGQKALEIVRKEAPHAIITAQHLSDMTGVQLAEKIRAENQAAATGFVLISSRADSSQVGSLSKCGKAVLLHKPFTSEQLLDALKTVSAVPLPPSPHEGRARLHVLIVDDSAAARIHMRTVLQKLGLAQFKEAADGAQAVAAVARESFDLIVTDYNMPLMDGQGFVCFLKQNPTTASIPTIMVTTEEDPAKLEAVRRLGVAAVCNKSFPPEVAQKIIDQLVSKS